MMHIMGRMAGGKRHMGVVKGAISAAVSLVIVATVTAILWYVKQAALAPHHPVFFYLFPITLVAVLYGIRPAILCAITEILLAAFFLYDPIYSFQVANRLEFGELVCFAVLASIAAKCVVELLPRVAKIPATTTVVEPFIRIRTPVDPGP